MSRKQERSQKAFSSAITLAATDFPHSFYEASLAHVALLLPVLNFSCKRNLLHYGTSGSFRSFSATRQKRTAKRQTPAGFGKSKHSFASDEHLSTSHARLVPGCVVPAKLCLKHTQPGESPG